MTVLKLRWLPAMSEVLPPWRMHSFPATANWGTILDDA